MLKNIPEVFNFHVNSTGRNSTSLIIGCHDQNSIEGCLIYQWCVGWVRLGNNNYEQSHLENGIMPLACEEGQPWEKDKGNREKGIARGSMSEKEVRRFRKRLDCGAKGKESSGKTYSCISRSYLLWDEFSIWLITTFSGCSL